MPSCTRSRASSRRWTAGPMMPRKPSRRRSKSIRADAAGYEQLARLYAKTGRLNEAVSTYEAAIKARPEDPNLHYFLGTLYSFGGAQDKAIERYEDAIKYGPDLAYPKNDLAYIYAESGENLDRALDLAQDAKAALPDTATVADTLGWVLYKRGIPSAAISYLKEAVANSDGDIAVLRASACTTSPRPTRRTATPKRRDRPCGVRLPRSNEDAEQKRASGEPISPEPAWATEARAMLARLESRPLTQTDTGFDLKPPGRAVDTGTSTCVARPIRESDPAGKQPAVARDSTSSFGGMR